MKKYKSFGNLPICAQKHSKQMCSHGCTLHSGFFTWIYLSVMRHAVGEGKVHKQGIELKSRKSCWPFSWMSGWRSNPGSLAAKSKKFFCPSEKTPSVCYTDFLPDSHFLLKLNTVPSGGVFRGMHACVIWEQQTTTQCYFNVLQCGKEWDRLPRIESKL